MIDDIRNFLLILTSVIAILITLNKFLFNLAINYIKLEYKLECEESSFVESIITTVTIAIYGVVAILFVTYIILLLRHVSLNGNNSTNNLAYNRKFLIFIFIFNLVGVASQFSLITNYLKSKLNGAICKNVKMIYTIAVISILISIMGIIFEIGIINIMNSRIVINDSYMDLYDVQINTDELNKEGFNIYLNNNEIKTNNGNGRMIIINGNKSIFKNIDSSIRLRDNDTLEIKNIANDKNGYPYIYSYSSVKEMINLSSEYLMIILYYILLVISGGIGYLNYKLAKQKRYSIIFSDEKEPIKCLLFLEYNEYYLIVENNVSKYINKKEVKEILSEEFKIQRNKASSIENRMLYLVNILRNRIDIILLVLINVIGIGICVLYRFGKMSILIVIILSAIIYLVFKIKNLEKNLYNKEKSNK